MKRLFIAASFLIAAGTAVAQEYDPYADPEAPNDAPPPELPMIEPYTEAPAPPEAPLPPPAPAPMQARRPAPLPMPAPAPTPPPAPAAPLTPQAMIEPYAPFKLVGMMPDTNQALLWAEVDGEYVLARTGDDLDGWKVVGVDARVGRLALQKEDIVDELDLVRLPRANAVIVFRDSKAGPAAAIAPTVIDSRPPAPPAPPPPPPVLEESRTLARTDVDREINDFDRLMSSLRVGKADGGGFTIVKLDPKSWVASLGFKQGDTVRKVAGEQVSTVEDAARLYARLRALDGFDAEIERGPQKVVLKFAVK